ncbi:hypothetical protein D3C75_1141820 [compost metagenome]
MGAQTGDRVHPQAPPGHQVGTTGLGASVFQLAENMPTALQVTAAYLGQPQPAGGTLQ